MKLFSFQKPSSSIFTLLLVASATSVNAQLSDKTRVEQLDNLLTRTVETENDEKARVRFITPYILDSIIVNYQNTLSGSQVEAGKLIGTSVSVTDKGATANIGLKRIKSVYTQLTVSGRGKENFINLLSDNQYGNTISGGGQLQLFGKSSSFFYPSAANRLHNRLALLKENNGKYDASRGTPTTAYDAQLTYIFKQIQNLQNGESAYTQAGIEVDPAKMTAFKRKAAEDFTIAADTLMKLGILPKNFLKKTSANRQADISKLGTDWDTATKGKGPDARRLRYYLADAEGMQMKANINALSFRWWTVAAAVNVTPYKILDLSAKEDNYTATHNDYYFSSSVSYNYLFARLHGSERRIFISPTIGITTARIFKDDDKFTLAKLTPYVIGEDNLLKTDMTTEVYPEKADRKVGLSVEMPFVMYWNKKNFGFEVSPKAGMNDPKGDNYGLRVGVFIPAQIKDGVPILVEPLFRLQKLFATGDADFWKDNVVAGFNVSVSLPKGLGKVGN